MIPNRHSNPGKLTYCIYILFKNPSNPSLLLIAPPNTTSAFCLIFRNRDSNSALLVFYSQIPIAEQPLFSKTVRSSAEILSYKKINSKGGEKGIYGTGRSFSSPKQRKEKLQPFLFDFLRTKGSYKNPTFCFSLS